MTTFLVKEILRRDPANIIVRLEKWRAKSDDPDRYKWCPSSEFLRQRAV